MDECIPIRDFFDLRDEISVKIPAMELCPGVLFYEISEYAGICSIPLMESLSTSIQKKLNSNLSAFQYFLIKKNVT